MDSYWGLKCIGKYETHEQISSLPAYTSDLQIGDLIYADINNDGQIDTNDRIILSHTLPRMNYAINLGFGYKNFEIQIVGTGAAFFQTPMTNSYFWNGWGDGNYSAFVRDNIGGDYPRLAYTKSSNNFVQSDFWLRDGGWFKIQGLSVGMSHVEFADGAYFTNVSIKNEWYESARGLKKLARKYDPNYDKRAHQAFPAMYATDLSSLGEEIVLHFQKSCDQLIVDRYAGIIKNEIGSLHTELGKDMC